MNEPIHQQLSAILHHPTRPLSGLAAVVFQGGDIVDEYYLGHRFIDANAPANNLPVTRETKFRVASISKLVASIGVMQLVEAGKLSLDRDVSDDLGFTLRNPHHPETPITLRMLLSHTSSIRDGGEAYSLPLPYHLHEFFLPDGHFYHGGIHWAPPTQQPGRFFTYCNLNFGVIGTLIEIASGERFDLYMRRHLFEPLGLEASYNVRDLSDAALENLAILYRKQAADGTWQSDGPWVPQVDDYGGVRPDSVVRVENPGSGERGVSQSMLSLDDYQIGSNGTLFSPQGGLRISPVDLVTIGRLLAGSDDAARGTVDGVRLLAPESVAQMLTPMWRYDEATPNGEPYGGLMRCWGLGLQLITNEGTGTSGDRLLPNRSLPFVGHAGDAYGLLSGLWLDPGLGDGFAFCIGGVGADPEENQGAYSSFYRWEEEILTALSSQLAASSR